MANKKREQAAQLLAEDRHPDIKIAELCGISERNLQKWKQRPEFRSRINELTGMYADRALKFGLARRERRLSVLSDMHERLLMVIEERGKDPQLASVPGGKSGLVVRRLRGLSMLREEYEADVALVRELRGLHEQIAKELGQWTEKSQIKQTVDFEDMSDEQLEKRMCELMLQAHEGVEVGEEGVISFKDNRLAQHLVELRQAQVKGK